MALQPVFKPDYIEYLKTHIDPTAYMQDKFEFDESQVNYINGIQQPEGLLEKLNPTPEGDLQSAIAIFEAYQKLSPLVAQQDVLWVYLTHANLFDYVKKRWPIDENWNDEKIKNHILNHWHHNLTNFLRTSFAGMWWKVYLTKDSQREDPYELTRVMYECGTDFVGQRFGELSMIRYKESMIGILEFLRDNPDIYKSNFVARGQYISRYFNLLGGTKQLAALDKDFFYKELEKKKDLLLRLTSTDQIHNKIITL